MPNSASKMPRALKMIARDRRIFVSTRGESDEDNRTWANRLFEEVNGLAGEKSGFFAKPFRSSDLDDSGDVVLKAEWVKALRGKGEAATLTGKVPVTDIIGVCSRRYLNVNMFEDGEAPFELAEFIDEIVKESAATDMVRVWLAPVEKTLWNRFTIRQVSLADVTGEHTSWLIRLKEDNARYRSPSEKGPEWKDEIFDLVRTVIDFVEADESATEE